MSKVLFFVTELQRPVGGLYRYSIELLPAWRKAFESGKTEFEPLVVSLSDPSAPKGDLKEEKSFAAFTRKTGIKVFGAVRGGERCHFLEHELGDEERNALHFTLWDRYRIKSESSAGDPCYRLMNSFWDSAPKFAEHLAKKEDIALIDAQDWLAFPAGFIARERIKKPLHCRFHSGEFGRALGRPQPDSAPLHIEAAALQEADFVSGVSIGDAKFEVYKLLPLKQQMKAELQQQRGHYWKKQQDEREDAYEEFLLFESAQDLELVTRRAAGLTNGIILDSWKKVTFSQIAAGKKLFSKLLPGKAHYVFFIGRAEYRKGIDALLNAMSLVRRENVNVGLVVSSSLSPAEYQKHYSSCVALGIEEDVALYNGWLEEETKKSMICAADVIALPSLYEPFGIVTLEALAADMACELNGVHGPTVVVGDTGGMSDVIRNGVSGFKVPMEEDNFDMRPDMLAKILKLSLSSDELHARISKGGVERVQSRFFDWNFIVFKVFEVYKRAIENYCNEVG
ncbi:MAG: glycosyltransferase family 4 protein [Candidatus Micrarchaeota archaeon]